MSPRTPETASPQTASQQSGEPAPAPEQRAVQRPWLVVLLRELGVKARDRSVLISTAVTLALIVGGLVLSSVLSERSAGTAYDLAAVGDGAAAMAEAAEQSLGDEDTVEAREASRAEAEGLLADDEVDAALVHEDGSWLLLGGDELSGTLEQAVTQSVSAATIGQNAQAAGTSMEELSRGSEVRVEHLGGEDRAAASFILRYAFAFLFYMAAIMFGVAIANSVLEEKQNRVVEILATAIPVRQILYGKVLGNCVMAFVQMGLYAGVGLLVATALGLSDGLGWAMSASGWFIAFFVVGFAAQAAIWAALGSLASRSEDLSTSMTPIMTVLVAAMMVGMFASGPWLAIASYIPIMSSIAMPVRLLEGEAAAWEPIASLAVCLVFGWVMLRIGEKVYQRAVFQGGRSLSWRQALQLED
ncbi:ABC transporter permease [Kocuria palustris]|uniref:ABC transporter permease n=1 Tax=Kocuria palustris TaxID=71999 RepID=UPI0011A5CFB3|nr:ABC transporter permease [Kocuria palustris]